jgi:ACR3 family arsenite transporter
MHVIPTALHALGRHGPTLLVVSLIGGLLVPGLSVVAEPMVPEAAFLLTLGSFLSAVLSPRERVGMSGLVPMALVFVGIGVPAIVYGLLHITLLRPATELAILVATLAPPVGSAAAIAAMLSLRPRLALAVSILLTLASPVIIPSALALAGFSVAVDFSGVVVRLLVIVGVAALLSVIVVRWRSRTSVILPDAKAAAGLSVIGLIIVGLAVTHGVAPLVGEGGHFLSLLALSAATNVGLSLLGAVIFLPAGPQEALTIGLLSGNRNVTLAWAVAGSSLPWEAQAYLAVCVIPILALPLLIKLALSVPRWGQAKTAAATESRS